MRLSSFPHYRQSAYNDCGPTCIKIISKHFGQTFESEFIRGACHITEAGISVSDLATAAEGIGFRAMVFELSFAQLVEKAILPCIAFIDDKHFIVIYKITRRYIYVSDPAKSAKKKYEYKYFKSRFLNRKTETGTIICLEPQPSFFNIEPSGKESKHRISYLRITLQYLKPYKLQLMQLVVIMIIITILQGITPFIFRSILDIGVDKKNIDFINIMFIANLVILFGIGFANVIKDFINKHIGIRFSTAIISNYLIKLLSLPIPIFQRLSGGGNIK